jgi:methyl-accepting chemotaxis protein
MRTKDAAELEAVFAIRRSFAPVFMAFLWANGALVVAAGWWRDTIPVSLLLVAAVALAGVPTLAWRVAALRPSTPAIGAAALAALVALLVAAFRQTETGPALQIDMHMYFFASMAVCVGWVDWRAILSFGLFVTLHHLGTDLAFAAAVFPDGGGIARVLLHGGIVAVEGIALVWVIGNVLAAVATAEGALAAARSATAETHSLRLEAEERGVSDARWREDMQTRSASLQATLTRLGRIVEEQLGRMDGTAKVLSTVASETIRQVTAADQAAQEAASFVREVSRAALALAEAEGEISAKVNRTSQVTRDATATARDMNARVEKLAEAARRIGDVVQFIGSIADQTNLLALNATIEAARAGEAGRGFAVVAQEVKGLAGQTARSSGDIAELAGSIRNAAEAALAAVAVIEDVMTKIDASTQTIASAMEEQGVATAGISDTAVLMRRGTEVVVAAIAGVTGAAAETSTAALDVKDATRSVSAAIGDLTRELDAFLHDILPERAAA